MVIEWVPIQMDKCVLYRLAVFIFYLSMQYGLVFLCFINRPISLFCPIYIQFALQKLAIIVILEKILRPHYDFHTS